MTPEERAVEQRKVSEASQKVCEAIKELIHTGNGLSWQEKSEMLEEVSSESDDHATLEEFLGWCDQFLQE